MAVQDPSNIPVFALPFENRGVGSIARGGESTTRIPRGDSHCPSTRRDSGDSALSDVFGARVIFADDDFVT